jgi:two-component system response regulator MprA
MGHDVLVVEDDAILRRLLVRALSEHGLAAEGVATGGDALRRLDARRYAALVLDIGLPDADGRDVCQALRAHGSDVPVLFLTARDALPDRLSGFRAGGDDYVTKPFALAEVTERVRALVRRGSDRGATTTLGSLVLDPMRHTASAGGVEVRLTPTEFRLLALLLARPGDAVRRATLVHAGWPHGAIVRDNTLDVYMGRLRRKLRALVDAPSIETVHGVGYAIADG